MITRFSSFIRSFTARFQSIRSGLVLLFILLLNLLLVSPRLMPPFGEINRYDEAKYIESGWTLLRSGPRDLAWGPIVALIYSPVHLVVGHSLDWFMIEAWTGRFLMFALLWLSLYLLAREFKEFLPPIVMAGIVLVSVPFFLILVNPSDAVYVSLSILGLGRLIAYYRNGRFRDLALASLFVGLGVLARVESVLQIGTLLVLAFFIRRGSIRRVILGALVPALAVLGIYFLASVLTTGGLNLGVGQKSYLAFEVSQDVGMTGDTENAVLETRRLFGTEAENGGSMLRAILRNPPAFAERVWANIKQMPVYYFYFFGKTSGSLLLFFAAWGVYILIRRRALPLLALLVLWPVHVAATLGLLALHIIPQVCFVPLMLGAVGAAGAFYTDLKPFERAILLLAALIACAGSLATHKPAFLFAALLAAAVISVTWLTWPRLSLGSSPAQMPLLLLLAAGLILHGPFPFPNYPAVLGASIEEQGIHTLEQALPVMSSVLVPFPSPAVAARMNGVESTGLPDDIKTTADLWAWLKDHNIQAIYLDSRYRGRADIYDLSEQGIGHYFDVRFASRDNVLRVLMVRPS